jgi:hypothetical protein
LAWACCILQENYVKKIGAKTLHIFSYIIDLDYTTFEVKQIVAQ